LNVLAFFLQQQNYQKIDFKLFLRPKSSDNFTIPKNTIHISLSCHVQENSGKTRIAR
jgi:hypothetical protein